MSIVNLRRIGFALVFVLFVPMHRDVISVTPFPCPLTTSSTGQRCVLTVSLHGAKFALTLCDPWVDKLMKRQTSKNTGIDRLIQYTISPWPKTAEKLSQEARRSKQTDGGRNHGRRYGRTHPLIEMRGRNRVCKKFRTSHHVYRKGA